MSELAVWAGLLFGLKAAFAFGLSRQISVCGGSLALSVALGWLLAQIILVGAMLAASWFNGLAGLLVWSVLLVGAIVSNLTSPARKIPIHSVLLYRAILPLLAAAGVGAILFYRALYLFDTTWDAMVYELPRVLLYVQQSSLFAIMPTVSINLFVNEWNGELLAVALRLALGTDQAINLMGVEVWGWIWVVFYAGGRVAGLDRCISGCVSLLLSTSPAVLGLSMVVKGDLLALGCFVLSGICIIAYMKTRSKWMVVACLISLSFGAGSKIILVPAAGLLGGSILWRARKEWKSLLPALLYASPFILLPLARYGINLAVYGSPFKRVDVEEQGWSFHSLIENAVGLGPKLFDFDTWIQSPETRWVFAYGAGASVIMALVAAVLAFVSRRKSGAPCPWSDTLCLEAAAFLVSWLLILISVAWKGWAFRYHLPWTYALAFSLLIWSGLIFKGKWLTVYSLFLVAGGGAHVFHAFERGEVNPIPLREARGLSDMQRKLAFHGYFHSPELKEYADSSASSILVLNELDAMLLPFLGTEARHRVALVESVEKLKSSLSKQAYPFVGLSGTGLVANTALAHEIESLGYMRCVSSPAFVIFRFKGNQAFLSVK